jgi:molecular chaperone DnaJ
MADRKDYYKLLGVGRDASQDDIKNAFRQLARKYHPDVNPGDAQAEEKFKEINEAYGVLGDPEKRTQYDQYGTAAFKPEDYAGFRESRFNFDDLFSDFGLGDIFGTVHGFGRRSSGRERPRQGADLKYDLEITLEDAYSGIESKIEIPVNSECRRCNGTGAEPGYLKECPNCNGTGEIRRTQQRSFMHVISVTPCRKCNGTGKLITKKCSDCNGAGRTPKTRKIDVKIPAGVDDGSYLRVAGQGEDGSKGAPAGDLYVLIHVKPHETFERHESNLYCKTTITLSQAILGSEIPVQTISGRARIKIPPGTQSHTVFKLEGQGMPDLHSRERGDQLVRVVVDMPKKLSKRQEELLREYAREEIQSRPETTKGFFERLREHL